MAAASRPRLSPRHIHSTLFGTRRMGSFTPATGIAILWVLLSSFCYGSVRSSGPSSHPQLSPRPASLTLTFPSALQLPHLCPSLAVSWLGSPPADNPFCATTGPQCAAEGHQLRQPASAGGSAQVISPAVHPALAVRVRRRDVGLRPWRSALVHLDLDGLVLPPADDDAPQALRPLRSDRTRWRAPPVVRGRPPVARPRSARHRLWRSGRDGSRSACAGRACTGEPQRQRRRPSSAGHRHRHRASWRLGWDREDDSPSPYRHSSQPRQSVSVSRSR